MKNPVTKLLSLIALALTASCGLAANLEITADDTMRFSQSELETVVGQETTLVFKNVGTLPKAAMGHNLVLLKPGTDLATFGSAAIAAATNDYIPTTAELSAQVITHTKVLGPGESETISFTIEEPGEYPFICSFPGHWVIMRGILLVN